MRLPLMTTRTWMVAMAAIAVQIWSGRAAARWNHFRKLAEYHASEFTKLRTELAPALEYRREAGRFPGCGPGQAFFEAECEQADWHGRLKSKHEHAAARPWIPVEPDSPEPG
jgi:hypothetical protein